MSEDDCVRIRTSQKIMIVFMVIGLFSAGILAGMKIDDFFLKKPKIEESLSWDSCQEKLFWEGLKVKQLEKEAEELKRENKDRYEKLITVLIATEMLRHLAKMSDRDRQILNDTIRDADPTREKLFTPERK